MSDGHEPLPGAQECVILAAGSALRCRGLQL